MIMVGILINLLLKKLLVMVKLKQYLL